MDKINKLLQGKKLDEEHTTQPEMEPEDKQAQTQSQQQHQQDEDVSAVATILDIEEKQQGLVDRLVRVHSQVRDREQSYRPRRTTGLPALSGSLASWKRSVEALESEALDDAVEKEDHTMAKAVQAEIRSLKGALLNRRVYV